jgi:5-methylcytosine-specific restriction endonuclease McrA
MSSRYKICAACKQSLPVRCFIERSDRLGQFLSYCRPCWCIRAKKRYATNEKYRRWLIKRATDAVRERRKDPAFRERDRKWSRDYKRRQLADPVEYEKHLARNRAWCAAHPDRVAQYESRSPAARAKRAARRYERLKSTAAGRKKLKAARQKWAPIAFSNRRALKLGAEGTHTRADFDRQLAKQSYRCFWCSADIRVEPTEDHYVPLARGGSNGPDNIVAACRSCNSRKWAHMPDEFRKRIAV